MNMLEYRDPAIYGKGSFAELATYLWKELRDREIIGIFFQSNHEGDIVDRIQLAKGSVDAIIINADSYAFTSIAIRDAIKAVDLPTVQVMFTEKCEADPSKTSYLTDVCEKTVAGKGARGFIEAAEFLKGKLAE